MFLMWRAFAATATGALVWFGAAEYGTAYGLGFVAFIVVLWATKDDE